MGGHSHWATTKRHKQAQDAKRGKIFTKLIREITIAARIGGGDQGNPRLRLAIAKAKEQNMPGDNIKKAIQRGTGELPGVTYEEGMYEGFGRGGVALLVQVTTDNKNRTISELRRLFTKHGGNMVEAGSVAWMFSKKGSIMIERDKVDEEKLLTLALEAGAEDVQSEGKFYEITTAPADFESVKKGLSEAGVPIASSQIAMVPQSNVPLAGKEAEQLLKLIEELEDHDDVQGVYGNFDIPDEVMERVAASG